MNSTGIRCGLLLLATLGVAATAHMARGSVDLLFSPVTVTAPAGAVIEIDFIARSDDEGDQPFAAIEAILNWDPAYVDLLGVDSSSAGYPFGPTNHFMPDPDGINTDLHDGNALFIALAQPGEQAYAPPEGLVVTTFRFETLAATNASVIHLLPTLGAHGVTRVRRLDLTDVTGDISAATTVLILACGTGDADSDGDVDLVDFASFQTCFTGPGGESDTLCRCSFDLAADEAIDFADFDAFSMLITGPAFLP
ncbi:MAG: hypothetical protein PVJ57_18735 [Phycisphaerae bacterium]